MTIDLKEVGSGFKRTSLNENFVDIEDAINNDLLWRDGSQPMAGSLDMNSERIINLPDADTEQEPVTLGQLRAAVLDFDKAKRYEVKLGSQAVGGVFNLNEMTYTPNTNNLEVIRNGQTLIRGVHYTEVDSNTVNVSTTVLATDHFVFKSDEDIALNTTTTASVSHVDNGVEVNLNDFLQSVTGSATYNTVATMTSTIDPRVGDFVRTAGYYAKGDGGSATYEIVSSSAFSGTPNGLTEIESGQVVYVYVDLESKWKSAIKWGLNATNMSAVVTAMKDKLGDYVAAMVVPAGDFTISSPIDIDFIGAGSIGQGQITGDAPTIIRPSVLNVPAVSIVKSKQVAKGATLSFFNIIDATTVAVQTSTGSVGVLVSEPPSGPKSHCTIEDISVNNGYAAIDFQDSAFGSKIHIKANYCYHAATGDNHDAQTSLDMSIKALGCFNGINVPRIYYSTVSAYFDQCGLSPAGNTYVPAGVLPIMINAEAWRGVDMPYCGLEFTVAPVVRADDYSALSMNLYFVHGNPTTWTRTFSGTRTNIDKYDGTEVLPHDEQALFMCDTGSVTVRNASIVYTTSFPTAATADTPLVYNRVGAPNSDAGINFDNCNIEHMSYIVKDRAGLALEDLGYDILSDTIYAEDSIFSQTGNSRIVLNHLDGDGNHLLKQVVSKDYTNNQIEYNFDKYSYSFYKTFSGVNGKTVLTIDVNNQNAANICNKVDIEIIDATPSGNTDGRVNVASFWTHSLSTITPAVAAGNKILMHECDVSSSSNKLTLTRTTGTFKEDVIVKVTVTGPNAFWHQNPTTPESDGGRGNLFIAAADVLIP